MGTTEEAPARKTRVMVYQGQRPKDILFATKGLSHSWHEVDENYALIPNAQRTYDGPVVKNAGIGAIFKFTLDEEGKSVYTSGKDVKPVYIGRFSDFNKGDAAARLVTSWNVESRTAMHGETVLKRIEKDDGDNVLSQAVELLAPHYARLMTVHQRSMFAAELLTRLNSPRLRKTK